MENKKPNVMVFRTKMKNRYMYDACTNRVFPAPAPLYEVAELYSSCSKEEIIAKYKDTFSSEECTNAYNTIDKWAMHDNAFFNYDERVAEFAYTKEDFIANLRKMPIHILF